jgi:adenosine kinase
MEAMPYVDLVFGNESEAEAFGEKQNVGSKSILDIAKYIAKLPKENQKVPRTVVITQGCDPTIVVSGD